MKITISLITILLSMIIASQTGSVVYHATPANYRSLINDLLPGDTLLLSAGTYTQGLPVSNLAGNANADYALVFGFQDDKGYYYMLFNRTLTNTSLSKVINGTRETLATATDNWWPSDGEFHAIELRVVSDNIEVRLEDDIVLQHTDGTFSSGQILVWIHLMIHPYFDDIRITTGSSTVVDLIFANA